MAHKRRERHKQMIIYAQIHHSIEYSSQKEAKIFVLLAYLKTVFQVNTQRLNDVKEDGYYSGCQNCYIH